MHSSFLHIGHLRLPVYGVLAAFGLMAALTLSQRTARYVNLNPESLWNVGVFAILSAFAVSRLFLIALNLDSFLHHPLFILEIPSLTVSGLFVSALFVLGYIRYRKLSLLPLLDAAAPCAALLWAFLSLGAALAGTRDGMPMQRHLALSNVSLGSDHPVELYTCIAASLLCLVLLRTLRAPYIKAPTASIALIGAGLTVFFVDFFRVPSDLLANSWLDPSQILGLAMVLTGIALAARDFFCGVRRNRGSHAAWNSLH